MTNDWLARSDREAAAILAEAMPNASVVGYAQMLSLVAVGWLQGVNYGSHYTLAQVEVACDRARDAL